jgi:hypothetical protein
MTRRRLIDSAADSQPLLLLKPLQQFAGDCAKDLCGNLASPHTGQLPAGHFIVGQKGTVIEQSVQWILEVRHLLTAHLHCQWEGKLVHGDSLFRQISSLIFSKQ